MVAGALLTDPIAFEERQRLVPVHNLVKVPTHKPTATPGARPQLSRRQHRPHTDLANVLQIAAPSICIAIGVPRYTSLDLRPTSVGPGLGVCSNTAGTTALSDPTSLLFLLTSVKQHSKMLVNEEGLKYGENLVSLKELERWMPTGQVARKLSRSRQGVIDLAEARRLRAVKTAAGWLYDPESVEAFAERESKKNTEDEKV